MYEASEANIAASRERIDALMNMAPSGPGAEELIDAYGHSPAENQLYGQLLKAAHEGSLDFDPVENVKDFARAADNVEESTGVGDIEVPIDAGVNDPNEASSSTMLMIAQQVRLAHALGFISPGRPRIEDGKLKVRIVRPGANQYLYGPTATFREGQYVEHEDVLDPSGETIPADVVDSSQASGFMRVMEKEYDLRLNLTDEINRVEDEAANDRVNIPVQFVGSGAVPYYRGLMEALGYHTGPLEQTVGPDGKVIFGQYKIPVTGRRKGFEDAGQTQSETTDSTDPADKMDALHDSEYQGQKRNIDPNILRLAINPGAMTNQERKDALSHAEAEAGWDAAQNRVVVTDEVGNEYWGAEYPNVFTADGQIRGMFDEVPRDPDQRTTAMQLASDIEGRFTHVVIEFDNGEKILIRRTSGDIKSAKHQTFELESTKAAKRGTPKRTLDTNKLASLVIVPGEKLILDGAVSESNVSRITTAIVDETGRVPANQKTSKVKTNALGRFNRALVAA